MKGTCLRSYLHEHDKHHQILVHEWLLEQASKLGIQGGSVFRAIAGFGRHGVRHDGHFFELQGQLPIEVVFVLSDEYAESFLALIDKEALGLFCTKTAVDFFLTAGKS